MSWWNDLGPGVRQALLLAGGLLAGIILAMIIQAVASHRSIRHVLKLFERQTAEQRRIAGEEEQGRREHDLVSQRQEAYARFMSLAWRYERASADLFAARREAETAQRPGTDPAAVGKSEHHMLMAMSEHAKIRDDMAYAREMIRLVAPIRIRFAADRWFIDLASNEAAQAQRAKSEFIEQARIDIGTDPAPPVPDAAHAGPPRSRS